MIICTCVISGVLAAVTAAPPAVRAVTIEGQSLEANWSGVSPAGAVVLIEDGKPREISPDGLMLLRWPVEPASRPTESGHQTTIDLADGSRVIGRIIAGDAKHVTVATEPLPELRLPLTELAGLRWRGSDQPEALAAFEKALAERDPSQDTLFVVREGRVTALKGVTESLGPGGGSFRWRERSVPIQAGSAFGIVFAAGVQPPAAAQATCRLTDGSRWAGKLAGGDERSVIVELGGGTRVALPVARIEEIRFRSDRVLFLSDLTPAEFVMEPFGTTRWPYRKDRSVANRPMRIGEEVFERGLGVHSRSVLTFDLPGRFSRLAAVIGIDAGAAPLGNVVFRVTADGRDVFNSGPVTGRDPPRPISVPIEGAKRIQLIVDFGGDLDIGDQADWAHARLIR
ncbi:MAG: NPCBM/NEW2 domain-containing protein [Phycisphaerae bacterium]